MEMLVSLVLTALVDLFIGMYFGLSLLELFFLCGASMNIVASIVTKITLGRWMPY